MSATVPTGTSRGLLQLSRVLALAVWLGPAMWFQSARADHLSSPPLVLGERTDLPDEGYLSFLPDPGNGRFGDEWTGWLDVRHPSLAGPVNTVFGYGRSDHFFQVRSTVLTDNTGALPAQGPNAAARLVTERITDLAYANKAYLSQAGLSVIETATRNVVSPAAGMANSFRFPLTTPADFAAVESNNGPAPRIELYYGRLAAGELGSTSLPSTATPSIVLDNTAPQVGFPDTFSHELYHFVGDGMAVQNPRAGDLGHSSDPRNVVAAGSLQWSPGMAANHLGAGRPPFTIPDSTNVIGPRLFSGAGGVPQIGGVDQITSPQVQRTFSAPNVGPFLPAGQRLDVNAAGDRVDWDFVADHRSFMQDGKQFGLEGVGNGADNHLGPGALFYGLAPTESPNDPAPTADNLGKDHRGMAVFKPTADYIDSGNKTFRTVDVFSLDTQFADSDATQGIASTGDRVLDYDLFFLGVNDAIVPGQLNRVFIDGWAPGQHADDYLGRWVSPIPAVGVFIRAHEFGVNGHDGNVQIDAIIASPNAVPEPSVLILMVISLSSLAAWRWYGRHERRG